MGSTKFYTHVSILSKNSTQEFEFISVKFSSHIDFTLTIPY